MYLEFNIPKFSTPRVQRSQCHLPSISACSRVVEIKAYSFQNFPITYYLSSSDTGKPSTEFAINPESGLVDLLRMLDYETDPEQYFLKVKAVEQGPQLRTSTVRVSTACMTRGECVCDVIIIIVRVR